MASGETRATSFGEVAADYDRLRPGPPQQAHDWLIPPDCGTAIDIAAGTGLFTRALQRRVGNVIAVEPDDRMREVLAARSPGVLAVEGRGEVIPVPDGSADGVFVSSAWHWLDPGQAIPEIARVLADGGRLGVIWTGRDRQADWVAKLDLPRRPQQATQQATQQAAQQETRREASGGAGQRRHEVTLPPGAPFENVATASFTFARCMTVDQVIGWLATYSGLIAASGAERAAALAHARQELLPRAGSDGLIEIPMRSHCWRADRTSRVHP
jgi:ubiquinone/menaquinone biosynthesis C-methylase UbiE